MTARFVMVVSRMATGSCAPVTARWRMPPSVDSRVAQMPPPDRATLR